MTKARDLANSADVFDTVSTTELGYLDGVTSAVQTQLDAKLATSTAATTYVANSVVDAKGDLLVGSADNTLSRLAVSDNGSTLVADSSSSVGLRWQGDYAAGKNRIINGNMVIDQRNSASSAVSITGNSLYSVDRWRAFTTSPAAYSIGQDSDAPAGFTKSLKATITTIDASVTGTDQAGIAQNIEGLNMSELQWGTANAKTITLSFWVRSSLTGTFGGAIRNSASDRSYPFSYSISVADTWEKKTITIPGETTGTWLYTNGTFCSVTWSLGAGSDRTGTAGAWNSNFNIGVTGQVQVVETLNATFYLTGVQFEIGNVATAFQTATGTIQGETALCQRYYEKSFNMGIAPTTTQASGFINSVVPSNTVANQQRYQQVYFKVTKRTAPTVTVRPYTTPTNTGRVSTDNGVDLAASSGIVLDAAESSFGVYNNSGGSLTTGNQTIVFHYEASAEL